MLSSIPNLNQKTNKQKGGIICFDIHLHFDCGWPCNWWPTNLSWLMESMLRNKLRDIILEVKIYYIYGIVASRSTSRLVTPHVTNSSRNMP